MSHAIAHRFLATQLLAVATLLAAGATHAAAPSTTSCASPRVLAPAAGTIITDGRPLVTWSKVDGATRYRVLLRSQVPNGPVITEIDNWITATQFAPPRALAAERANVTVRIVPDCSDEVASTRLRGDEHRFGIEMPAKCSAPTELTISRETLTWRESSGARSYEVAIFDTSVPTEILRTETVATSQPVPVSLPAGAVFAVRARCAAGSSIPAFALLR